MKKIISILACVCLLLSVMIIPVSAAEISATIIFDADKANRTEFSASIQVWEQDGIKLTNNKGASTSNVGDYSAPARFYKNSDVTIEYPGMTKIEIDVASVPVKNQNAWVNSNTTGTAVLSGDIITITFDAPIDSYYVKLTDNQARANSITVYAVAEEEEVFVGTDPEAPIELAVNEAVPAALTEIKVPAEGTVFVKAADANGIFHVTSTTGACTLINGMANQVEISDAYDLTLCGYEMVNIYNAGAETVTLYVFLEAGAGAVVGTWDNPEVLELMENPWMPQFPPSANAETVLEAGNQGYFYKLVATETGKFIINVSAFDAEYNTVGYQLSVTNTTTSWQSDLIAKAADADDYYDQLEVSVNAGDELLINAGTFNAADVWNAPAGTLNVQINFAPVGSYENPVVLDNTGANTATLEAGSQGYYYEWIATADGKVTVTINDETGWQYYVSKVPVDEDDYANYYNGDTHWYNDEPVVATETVKVKAGETIKVWVNTFDAADEWNAPAGTVNWTLDFVEVVAGDTDGDGAVSGKDVTALMQYLNEWDGVTVDVDAADVNGDGKLNGRDIALLLQYLNGWDVEL